MDIKIIAEVLLYLLCYFRWLITFLIIFIVFKIQMNKVDKKERIKYAEALVKEQQRHVNYYKKGVK